MVMLKLFLLSLLFIFSGVECESNQLDELETPLGKIKGTLEEDNSYVSFKGIRYGTYKRRFEPSYMVDNLQTENGSAYQATEFGNFCPQRNRLLLPVNFAEDCLFLNIWAPTSYKTRKDLQVMVFIHGGAYIQGSGNDPYVDGAAYAKKGVILVTINYRVGILGFYAHAELTRENAAAPTNFGLLDQITALKWIKKNIHLFGGNPEDMTVFGESAGASSIQWLLAHKDHKTSPLFNRVILQSAPAAAYSHELNESETMGDDVAKELGCQGPEVLECMRQISFDLIVEAQKPRRTFVLSATSLPYAPNRIASPHVDYINFPVHPSVMGINGDASSHEIIIGTNIHEWTLFIWVNHLVMNPSDEWMHKSIDLIFSSPHFHAKNQSNLVERIEKLYPREDFESGFDRVTAIYTDMIFYCASRNYGQKLVQQGAKIHFYLFDHIAEFGYKFLKSYHAAELPFVFQKKTPSFLGGMVKLFPIDFTEDELALSNQMISLWTSLGKEKKLFIGEGKNKTEWPQFTQDGENFLEIGIPAKSRKGQFLQEKCHFWDEVQPGPQESIVFDLMAHEPFLLKLANEYSLDFLVFLAKNAKSVLISLATFFAAYIFRKCFFAKSNSNSKSVKYLTSK